MNPKNSWSRRAFLRGAGVSLSLPLLPSLLPRDAWAAGDDPPVRLLFYYVPCGIHMAEWTPNATGAGYDLPTILQPLSELQDKVMVLSGLANMNGRASRPGDHARGTGCFITCEEPVYGSVLLGPSIDQVVAASIGDQTPFPSLQLGIDGGANSGNCDSGYACAYQRSISWADATTPLPKIVDPRILFDQLFSGAGGEDPAIAERRRQLQLSILDEVASDARSLQNKMAATDKAKLDQYLTGVREVEKRIDALGGQVCDPPDRPGRGLDVPTRVDIMADLMTVAFECDLTRVMTFMLANGGSGRSHTWIGAAGNHHGFSHHQGSATAHANLTKINTWEVQVFAELLQRLDSVTETNGTLLDNTLIMFGSEISDGNRHNHDDLPVLLAGGGGGAVRSGRHLSWPVNERRPISNLLLSMATAAGAPLSAFGSDSTGPLSELA